MSIRSRLVSLWRNLFEKDRVEQELTEEIQAYVEMLVETKIKQGLQPSEARRAAMIEAGGVEQVKESVREVRMGQTIEAIWHDLRYGVRMLLKYPGFTCVAVLTLALGIGANTAIFQLLDAVRLRTLPVKAPRELAEVRIADMKAARGGIGRTPSVTNPIWEQIRDRQQAFSGIFAWGTDSVNLAPGGEVRPARMLYASGDFFNTLGVQPALGRLFTMTDDQRGCGEPGLIISHEFWQREYGGDANVIGRKLTLADHTFEITGVTPASFYRHGGRAVFRPGSADLRCRARPRQ